MVHPMVFGEFLDLEQSRYVALNLLNLDNWPQWNSTVQRILSQKGNLTRTTFDLHRIERQQLIEEMWEVQFVHGDVLNLLKLDLNG